MDKNTLLGLLLMGLVIFGFMWLNQPDQQKLQETEQAAAIDEQQKEAAEAERSLAADTLTATERQGAAALVLSAGTVDAETGATEYRTCSPWCSWSACREPLACQRCQRSDRHRRGRRHHPKLY